MHAMRPEPDLRSFLDEIWPRGAGELLTISEEVPLDYTSTALTLELERHGRPPVLLFNRVRVTTCAWPPICSPPAR